VSNFYHQVCDLDERAEQMATILLRRHDDHELHRVGVSCRDLSNTIAQELSALSDDARKRIAELAA
jgi:hypothetical protein